MKKMKEVLLATALVAFLVSIIGMQILAIKEWSIFGFGELSSLQNFLLWKSSPPFRIMFIANVVSIGIIAACKEKKGFI